VKLLQSVGQSRISQILQKYPELKIRDIEIAYDVSMDTHPYYRGVKASTLITADKILIKISSSGLGNTEEELALTILHEHYHLLHPNDLGFGFEVRAEEYAYKRWTSIRRRANGKNK